ncbi:MAG: GNAT family N-acetyltransferase [Salinivirgaceae bacterium]|jgi:GNAT superfamily N-acetyltransferase|nr:GNAT family N-acetyltransferase [Salinivirgaceae bacterium]
MRIVLSEERNLNKELVLELYNKNKWSSAGKPDELMKALENSHGLITAWDGDKLVGLANSISDGHLVVYYPHLLVLPEYHGKGIGRMIMERFQKKYAHFHQQILVADNEAIQFYKKCGFERAGKCEPMWIYNGADHG